MARLDLRTFIRATPQRVWDVISDLSGQQRWMEDVHALEVVGDRQGGVGTLVRVTSKVFGLPLVRDVMEIVAWEPPRELCVVHRGELSRRSGHFWQFPLSGTAAFHLEPARGGTIFRWTEEFSPPLGALGELGYSLLIEPHLRRVFGRSMDNVRRIAEVGA